MKIPRLTTRPAISRRRGIGARLFGPCLTVVILLYTVCPGLGQVPQQRGQENSLSEAASIEQLQRLNRLRLTEEAELRQELERLLDEVDVEAPALQEEELEAFDAESARDILVPYLYTLRLQRDLAEVRQAIEAVRSECGPPFHRMWERQLGNIAGAVEYVDLNESGTRRRVDGHVAVLKGALAAQADFEQMMCAFVEARNARFDGIAAQRDEALGLVDVVVDEVFRRINEDASELTRRFLEGRGRESFLGLALVRPSPSEEETAPIPCKEVFSSPLMAGAVYALAIPESVGDSTRQLLQEAFEPETWNATSVCQVGGPREQLVKTALGGLLRERIRANAENALGEDTAALRAYDRAFFVSDRMVTYRLFDELFANPDYDYRGRITTYEQEYTNLQLAQDELENRVRLQRMTNEVALEQSRIAASTQLQVADRAAEAHIRSAEIQAAAIVQSARISRGALLGSAAIQTVGSIFRGAGTALIPGGE